jgi:hypothetical protein
MLSMSIHAKTLTSIVLLFSLSFLAFAAEPLSPNHPSSPGVEFAGILSPDFPPHDRWHPSLRVRLEVEVRAPGVPNLFIHRPTGELLASHTIWFPGATRVRLYSVALSASGAVAVLGYTNGVGRTASFVVLLESPSAQPSILRIERLAAIRARFAPDGSLWTLMAPLGYVIDDGPGPIPHETLWQISLDGRVLRKVLPYASLDLPVKARSIHDWNYSKPDLAVSASGVFVYIPYTSEIVESDFDGAIRRRIPLTNILAAGAHFLSRFDASPSGTLAATLHPLATPRRSSTLLLAPDATQWTPLRPGEPVADECVSGFEGSSLVTTSWHNRAIYRHSLP